MAECQKIIVLYICLILGMYLSDREDDLAQVFVGSFCSRAAVSLVCFTASADVEGIVEADCCNLLCPYCNRL